jgi:hypothetical protein
MPTGDCDVGWISMTLARHQIPVDWQSGAMRQPTLATDGNRDHGVEVASDRAAHFEVSGGARAGAADLVANHKASVLYTQI